MDLHMLSLYNQIDWYMDRNRSNQYRVPMDREERKALANNEGELNVDELNYDEKLINNVQLNHNTSAWEYFH